MLLLLLVNKTSNYLIQDSNLSTLSKYLNTVLNVRLFREVIGLLDGRGHPLHGEEGGQVGGVGGDQDQGEEPPDAAHDPGGGRPRVEVRPLLHQRAHREPGVVFTILTSLWIQCFHNIRRRPLLAYQGQACSSLYTGSQVLANQRSLMLEAARQEFKRPCSMACESVS